MFDNIIAYSIKHKFVIGLLVAALIGTGIFSLKNLPIDALPDITNNQVQIITTTPNLSTQEVELYITYPIELAVKSIPDIIELRSISRFGLSLITVVFEESTDIYWARNQINERLKEAESNIPEGFGSPELAPISTGLGEIFQYTVSAKEGMEEELDIMELRSIQDWIIVPQLLGTEGVAEVNTLGGILKEYEVAVNPDKLKSMGITMAEIFTALQKNNENTGGAYIDKKPNAYFIRSVGMVNSLDDVSKIVIKVNNDIPVLIRDVADVQYGNTVRYGATTRNGHGEVVNGMVMMLKGENSAKVVKAVKDRMVQIEKTLPEGVEINPYLDRSKLVNRAISTVKTNLIEGALIVIFILVLLIGNWRAGLIVASVIPLSLLFAVSMMRLFGVSGNLMSLGAIDFGLIVDGAVIIVEAIVHRLQGRKNGAVLTVAQMDDEVFQATSGIRQSAAFGEIIILIVYLPILALVGIEGKMFAPMAQTVAFAIFGAFILSLTYVPMMSALFLSRQAKFKETFSDKIIGAIQNIYTPVLNFVFKFKKATLVLAVGLFVVAFLLFRSLGGEFIPTLFEGDIATHVMIPPGSSLLQEVESTTRAEQLLMDNFPEIEQVVSKIGSAEVPTDPMPMEVADVMIIMKDKSEWTSASTKEEMFEKMEKVLDDLPGVTTEFSQPIQMRFNELMTGVRSDVGVKIYGENIDRLVSLGDKVEQIAGSIVGVEDARAETVSGLPQINIEFNKDKLALYGLNVSDLNQAVRMGFAGAPAGVIYEGEKMYNLVVRLDKPFRQDISNIQNLYVSLPSGNQIPLGQVAHISMVDGPAQINREKGKRRITVGFNVRNRDVESVVEEITDKLNDQLELPVGYYIEYSGQFENLKRAKSRLAVAVPIALAMIFVLLYFTFNSLSQSMLIFTAIPLSAIGGVFALWLRDMAFSISAGIGFIALFGVAVLNGIVLIGYFNQLKKDGMTDIMERIKMGTSVRLRPVIMTAAVASFGFLPMAISTSAGAEVQKPLATVVIGGLITATLLTLIVLPILYYYVEKVVIKKTIPFISSMAVGIMLLGGGNLHGQVKVNTVEKAIEIALENNGYLKSAAYNVAQFQELKGKGYLLPKTNFEASLGQVNTANLDQSYRISQSFNPFVRKPINELNELNLVKVKSEWIHQQLELEWRVREAWDKLLFHKSELDVIEEQIAIWKKHSSFAQKRFEVGESNLLEKTIAENELQSLEQLKILTASALNAEQVVLQSLLNTEDSIHIEGSVLERMFLLEPPIFAKEPNHPLITQRNLEIDIANTKADVFRGEMQPEFNVGYFIQSFKGEQTINNEVKTFDGVPRFQGINIGLNLPLFTRNYQAKIKAQHQEALALSATANQFEIEFKATVQALYKNYTAQSDYLNFYENNTLANGTLISDHAQRSYANGDIGYVEFVQAMQSQFSIKQKYLEALRANNEMVLRLQFLLN